MCIEANSSPSGGSDRPRVVKLPHGVELRCLPSELPFHAGMFSVKPLPSDHLLAGGTVSETLHIVSLVAPAALPSKLLLRMRHRLLMSDK